MRGRLIGARAVASDHKTATAPTQTRRGGPAEA